MTRASARPPASPGAERAPALPVDTAAALRAVDGDADLLAELNSLFVDDWPARRDDMRAAFRVGDSKGVERGAHGLKGVLAALGARPAAAVAAALEVIGREHRLDEAPMTLTDLEREVERVIAVLRSPAAAGQV